MAISNQCESCGQPITTEAVRGLCPACLMKVGLGIGSGTDPSQQASAEGKASGFVPPPLAELSQRFPHFEMLALIGQGGMGAVYKARQKSLDRLVALKILAKQRDKDPAFAERFAFEARTLARLNHPNIISVFDFGEAEGLCYLVMEFVDGVNLRQLLQTQKIAPKEALAIVPELCSALQYAHDQGIVHRDIKPENIMLDRQGRVKIADFGLAKLLGLAPSRARLTRPKDVMGTPHYMAPEQIEHPQEVDHRADIFSLGVVFYEMLTGELPLGKFAPPSHKVMIDVRLDEVVLRSLEKEPERRYQQASQVKTAIETISSRPTPLEKGSTGNQPSLADDPPPEVLKVKKSLWLASVALLILGLAVWGEMLFWNVLGFVLPKESLRPIALFLQAGWSWINLVPRSLWVYNVGNISPEVGTLALVAAWQIRRGRGFALANTAIILSFLILNMLSVCLPLGIFALTVLWRKSVRTAFTACQKHQSTAGISAAEARLGYSFALASAALVLVSFLCLPIYLLSVGDIGFQPGIRSTLFWGMRWLPRWTQGAGLVLGMLAMITLGRAGGAAKGLAYALFGTLFVPFLGLAGWLVPHAGPAPIFSPYNFELGLEIMLECQLLAALAAAVVTWWVAHRRAQLLQLGQGNVPDGFVKKSSMISGIVVIAYLIWQGPNWPALMTHQGSNFYSVGFGVVALLAGWLAYRQQRRMVNPSTRVIIQRVKWICWATALLLVVHASMLKLSVLYQHAFSPNIIGSSKSLDFLANHVHDEVPIENQAGVFKARIEQQTLELEAISEPTALGVTCWRPDGTPRCGKQPQGASPSQYLTGNRELIFCLSGDPDARNFAELHWEARTTNQGTEQTARSETYLFRNRKHGINGIALKVPDEASTARLRLGLPVGSWENTDAVWLWTGDKRALKKKSIRHADEDWEFAFGDLAETEKHDGFQVTLTEQIRRNGEARLIVVDTGGKVYEPAYERDHYQSRYKPERVGVTDYTTVTFPGILLKDLKELRFQVRSYHWVEFQNISLHPGQNTRVIIREGN